MYESDDYEYDDECNVIDRTPTRGEVREFDPVEKDHIRRGAKLLDRVRPSWFREINAKKLDLGTCNLCVLGQLYDNPGDWQNGYMRGLKILGEKVGNGELDPEEYGFGASEDCANRMWRYEIRRRRRAAAARAGQ